MAEMGTDSEAGQKSCVRLWAQSLLRTDQAGYEAQTGGYEDVSGKPAKIACLHLQTKRSSDGQCCATSPSEGYSVTVRRSADFVGIQLPR